MYVLFQSSDSAFSSTKRAIAKYMGEFMSAEVREDELVVLPSSTSAYDMLCHCTCEPGGEF